MFFKLTGHAKSNWNLNGTASNSDVKFIVFSPKTGVTTSPNVHGDVVSIFAW